MGPETACWQESFIHEFCVIRLTKAAIFFVSSFVTDENMTIGLAVAGTMTRINGSAVFTQPGI